MWNKAGVCLSRKTEAESDSDLELPVLLPPAEPELSSMDI